MQGPIQSPRCTYLYLHHSDFSYIKNKKFPSIKAETYSEPYLTSKMEPFVKNS